MISIRLSRFLPILIVTILVCGVAPAGARTLNAPSLNKLVLSPADIKHAFGPGFSVLLSRQTTNSDLRGSTAGLSQGSLAGLNGRVTGYVSMYTHPRVSKRSKVAAPGVLIVLSGVNLYKSTAYARGTLNRSTHTSGKLPKGTTEQSRPLRGVGDLAVILTVRSVVPGQPTTDSVYAGFQQGKYTALIDVAAYNQRPDVGQIVTLCKLLDARIRSNG